MKMLEAPYTPQKAFCDAGNYAIAGYILSTASKSNS
jgi:hypothetical protein